MFKFDIFIEKYDPAIQAYVHWLRITEAMYPYRAHLSSGYYQITHSALATINAPHEKHVLRVSHYNIRYSGKYFFFARNQLISVDELDTFSKEEGEHINLLQKYPDPLKF